MKKITLLAAFVFTALFSQAQDSNTGLEIGLKVSPGIANNRFSSPSGYDFKNENAKFRGSVGIVLDYFFGENYAFSSGLEYGVKGGKISYKPGVDISEGRQIDELNIQYLQIPVTLKLFTNEVATDTRIYFQLGASLNGRISSKINGSNFYRVNATEEIKANKRYNFFDADAILGAGAEWQLGTSTKIFGGLSYHRGLLDVDRFYEKLLSNKDIAVRNNFFALDMGIKF